MQLQQVLNYSKSVTSNLLLYIKYSFLATEMCGGVKVLS